MEDRITDQKIAEVAEKIAKEYQPEKIILFGSYAWGNPHKDSDVDLFIVKETENVPELEMEIDKFIFPRPFPIDIIVYRPKRLKEKLKQGDFFLKDVYFNGKTLYES